MVLGSPLLRLSSARALRVLTALAVVIVALALSGGALAAGGTYTFAGGTPAQQTQVRAALAASSFPWGIVPGSVTIEIAPGLTTQSTPGRISLDANLVDSGTFGWAIVQHEYAHQVDFLAVSQSGRAALQQALGARVWCWANNATLDHAAYGCERFASVLAWAYWRSADNALAPQGPGDEAGALAPAAFKRLLGQVLSGKQPLPPSTVAVVAAAPRQVAVGRTVALARPAQRRG